MVRHFQTLLFSAFIFICGTAFSQNYTSVAAGNWTAGATWSNTSGWGSATPPLSGQGSGTVTINHNISVAGNYSLGSNTLNVTAGSTLTINGNLTLNGGSTLNVSGILIVTGSATLSSNLNILPGGAVYISNSLTVNSAQYLTVGTNVAPPQYADLVVYGNLVSNGSGDILVRRNGRLAVFGNLTGSGGGTVLTVENGGQTYVHGNIAFTGGGSSINSNPTTPVGLYVNGTVTNSGGGSYTTPNRGDEVTMQNTNPPFYNWVSNLPMSPLPVDLLFFNVSLADNNVHVNWATATEKNAKSFHIERSSDGLGFSEIGSLNAAGNSLLRKDYYFTDDQPIIGRSYYRLKQVDNDGSIQYFSMRVIDVNGTKSLSVYPNPVVGNTVNLRLNFDADQTSVVRITDVSGRQLHTFTFNGNAQELEFSYQPGLYYVTVQTGQNKFTTKLIVP